MRVLTIDDDDLVRESIAVFLSDSGYEIIEACSGEQGINKFRQEKPDVVLCDLRMPDIDGLQVLETITQESPETPVIVISGAGLINDVVEALRLGAWDFLIKPISDMAVLEHAIESASHRSEIEQENQRYKAELEKANLELEQNLQLLKADQEAGHHAQMQLLPDKEIKIGQYHFSHEIIPSLLLSGDFVDYFEIDDRYIGFYIADISGHGSASAFVTIMLKSLVNQPLRRYRTHNEKIIIKPAQLMAYLNTEVISAQLGKYLTLFYGIIDQESNQLTYSIGGHYPRPVLINGGEAQFLAGEGFPIGLFDWVTYSDNQVDLQDDAVIGMFSDGLLEILSEPELKDKEQILLSLCDSSNINVADMVKKLHLDKIQEPPDDITLFIVNGPSSKKGKEW